jgi:ABC-type amino acid transport substrate-binding protein
VVQVGLSSDFAPFYAFEDSSAAIPQGFVSELLALWSERTGLRFEFRRYGNLDDVMAALRAGQIDLTPFTTPVGGRESYAVFTRPALATNLVLAARRDVPDVSPSASFGGRMLAVEAGSSIEALVRERFPEARLRREASAEQALRAVADGRADLFIGYQHVVVYLVERGLLANLELRTSLGPSATPLGPAVRRDLPQLRAILDKAIASVSVADQSRLACCGWWPARWGWKSSRSSAPASPRSMPAAPRASSTWWWAWPAPPGAAPTTTSSARSSPCPAPS